MSNVRIPEVIKRVVFRALCTDAPNKVGEGFRRANKEDQEVLKGITADDLQDVRRENIYTMKTKKEELDELIRGTKFERM